jgi:hypothetical protein
MLFLIVLCGIGAAVLRGFQLTESFHPQTSLIEPGDTFTICLMALSGAVAVASVVYAVTLRKKTPQKKTLGVIWRGAALIAPAVLFAASGYDLYIGLTEIRWGLISLGLLGLLATGALYMIAANIGKLPFSSATGFWATVPVFWACLVLIADFWGQMGNPVRNAYVYGMLAVVCCTLALYAIAGFFFGKGKPGRVTLFALPGIYLAILSAGGFLFARWLGDPAVWIPLPALFRLVFIALHLTVMTAAVMHGRFIPPEKAENGQFELEKEDA